MAIELFASLPVLLHLLFVRFSYSVFFFALMLSLFPVIAPSMCVLLILCSNQHPTVKQWFWFFWTLINPYNAQM